MQKRILSLFCTEYINVCVCVCSVLAMITKSVFCLSPFLAGLIINN